MKLEIFEFIDDSIENISKMFDILDEATKEVSDFIYGIYDGEDYFLNVTSRVKSETSLKEKILKNNLYMKCETFDELIKNISDLIGVRIDCRFISDEEKVFEKLKETFDVDLKNGYFTTEKNKNISLKLSEKQPQYQKNGFEIYKIDGCYKTKENTFNFELQIKSLVNNFWGDIEHRILYKNYNYIISEEFIKEIMSNIKGSLSLIDSQLLTVYNYVNSLENSGSKKSEEQIRYLLKKMIYDIYIMKFKNKLGFVVDFKDIVDLIVDFTFMKERKDPRKFGEDFLKILAQLQYIEEENTEFDKVLSLDGIPHYNCEQRKIIGETLERLMNENFNWHLFFRVIFDIETENHLSVFEQFVEYLYQKFEEIAKESLNDFEISEKDGEKILKKRKDLIVEYFCDNPQIETILDIEKHIIPKFTNTTVKY